MSLSLYPKQGKLVFVRFSDTGFQENLSSLPFTLRNYQYMYTACINIWEEGMAVREGEG